MASGALLDPSLQAVEQNDVPEALEGFKVFIWTFWGS